MGWCSADFFIFFFLALPGLLSCADALREFALQRLIQRLADMEPTPPPWQTVRACVIIFFPRVFLGTDTIFVALLIHLMANPQPCLLH